VLLTTAVGNAIQHLMLYLFARLSTPAGRGDLRRPPLISDARKYLDDLNNSEFPDLNVTLRARAKITSSTLPSWLNGVIPFAVECCSNELEGRHLLVADFDSRFVGVLIQSGFDD
jgi:hypothetical protein